MDFVLTDSSMYITYVCHFYIPSSSCLPVPQFYIILRTFSAYVLIIFILPLPALISSSSLFPALPLIIVPILLSCHL